MSQTLQQQILLETADFLEKNPRKWTRNYFARDMHGQSTDWRSGQAVRFCAIGALYRMALEYGVDCRKIRKFYLRQPAYHHERDLGRVNDTEGRKAVIAYLKKLAKG